MKQTKIKKEKILFIDSEGGHGGASRSLFYMVSNLSKKRFTSHVICRKNSFIVKEYQKKKINCTVKNNIPKLTSVKREAVNFYSVLKFVFYDWLKSYKFRIYLRKMSADYDYIHFNHINLFLLAYWLKIKNPIVKISMHIRTNPYPNFTSKLQAIITSYATDKLIFITENEYKNFSNFLINKNFKGQIIHNIVEKKNIKNNLFKSLRVKNTFKIGLVSNYSFIRGSDRFVNIIKELQKITKKKFCFIFAGDYKMSKGDRKKLGYFSKYPESLKDLSKLEKVEENCIFLGHIKNPETIYNEIDILIKPTRDYNPWGRDIIEAMAHGVPVFSIGSYNKFVNNKTGYLFSEFDEKKFAKKIKMLMENKGLLSKLSFQAKKVANQNCSARVCKKKFEKFWVDF